MRNELRAYGLNDDWRNSLRIYVLYSMHNELRAYGLNDDWRNELRIYSVYSNNVRLTFL